MEGVTIGNAVARAVLLISAAVVIGLSINQHEIFSDAKERCEDFLDGRQQRLACDFGRIIPSLAYGIAAGAFALFDGLVGLVAAFVSIIPWVAIAMLDGLTAIILLAHGINFAVLLRDIYGKAYFRGFLATRAQADTAFAFIGFIAVCLALGTVILARRR